MKAVLVVYLSIVGVTWGHLLPQALEDVHTFVQSELQQRSQGQLGIESPPSGGPIFQTAETQTFIGVPVVFDKGVRLDGSGGLQKPITEDLNTAQSQQVIQGDMLPRGLLPPSPMQEQQNQQQQAASNNHPQVIPANLVGPSTFVSEPQRDSSNVVNNVAIPQEIITQGNNAAQSAMDGWVPLDREGSKLAKGVGVKLQIQADQKDNTQSGTDLAYKGTGYTVKKTDNDEIKRNNNELEILPTNSIKLEDIVIDTKNPKPSRSPVYPGGARSPKIVIHAQNVILRGGAGESGETEISSANNNSVEATAATGNVRQFPAYSGVPQLNTYLRDQLRIAALNQLMQPRHPLNKKPFPRPLSLREIARAVRNGEFPPEPLSDPLLPQPASQLQFSVPHVVNMNSDSLSLPSIQAATKLPVPGVGLGSLYRNILQQDGLVPGGNFDPREPLEYSLLAALSGQNLKVPGVPTFKSRPSHSPGYGDSVAYTTGKEEGKRDPIQIVQAAPAFGGLLRPPPELNSGSLRGVSEQLLKQMILQELGEIQETPNILLPAGISNSARPPMRHLRPSYGTNAHPFAHLAGGQGGSPDHVFEETFEYTLPPGTNLEDIMNDEGSLYGKRPSKGYTGLESGSGVEDSAVPLNKDTLLQLGKGLFNSALEFSRHHNPMTLLSKIRSLPPVKVDLYKVPMGVPESLMGKWSSDDSGSRNGPHYGGRGSNRSGGKRGRTGRRKHSPRKNSSKYH